MIRAIPLKWMGYGSILFASFPCLIEHIPLGESASRRVDAETKTMWFLRNGAGREKE